jgi:hypothetical protein
MPRQPVRPSASTATTLPNRSGSFGRVVHGKNKAEWLKELRIRIAEPFHYTHDT